MITPSCHPDRRHAGHGLCVRCYGAQWRAGEYGARANVGARPLIDLDLGHACQYGYHRPAIRVTEGPNIAIDWQSPRRAHLAAEVVIALVTHEVMTTADLAAEIGTDQPNALRPVLAAMLAKGELEQIAAPRFQPCHWRLAA